MATKKGSKKRGTNSGRRSKRTVRISAADKRPKEQEPPIIVGGGGSSKGKVLPRTILKIRKNVVMTPISAAPRYYRWRLEVDLDEVDVFEGGVGNEYAHPVDPGSHSTSFWE